MCAVMSIVCMQYVFLALLYVPQFLITYIIFTRGSDKNFTKTSSDFSQNHWNNRTYEPLRLNVSCNHQDNYSQHQGQDYIWCVVSVIFSPVICGDGRVLLLCISICQTSSPRVEVHSDSDNCCSSDQAISERILSPPAVITSERAPDIADQRYLNCACRFCLFVHIVEASLSEPHVNGLSGAGCYGVLYVCRFLPSVQGAGDQIYLHLSTSRVYSF